MKFNSLLDNIDRGKNSDNFAEISEWSRQMVAVKKHIKKTPRAP